MCSMKKICGYLVRTVILFIESAFHELNNLGASGAVGLVPAGSQAAHISF
jgi:hypothetical protein